MNQILKNFFQYVIDIVVVVATGVDDDDDIAVAVVVVANEQNFTFWKPQWRKH